MFDPSWTSPDTNGIQIHLDGSAEQIVALWSDGVVTAGTIWDLCIQLVRDAEQADCDEIPQPPDALFVRISDGLDEARLSVVDVGNQRVATVSLVDGLYVASGTYPI